MEDRIKQLINNNKSFVIFYLVWFLFNLFILVTRVEERLRGRSYIQDLGKYIGGWKITDKFWPFGSFELAAYDRTEFIFYLIAPFIFLGIWKLVKNDIINNYKKYLIKKSKVKVIKQENKVVFKQFIPLKKIKSLGVITLLIVSIIAWSLFYYSVALYEMQGKSSIEMVRNVNSFLLIFRIAAVLTLTNKAKELNVSKWEWGIFGFFFPIISLFIMLNRIYKSNRLFRDSQLANEKG